MKCSTQRIRFQILLNQILITLLKLIQHQTEFCLSLNQSEKCNYNPNLVSFNKIQNRVFGVQRNWSPGIERDASGGTPFNQQTMQE